MKFIHIPVLSFLLLLSLRLFGADQITGLFDALTKNAQNETDQAHLFGLLKASSLIDHVQLKGLFKLNKETQFASQARCRYSVSQGFEKALNDTVYKVHDPDLKAELIALAKELNEMHRKNDAYATGTPLWYFENCLANDAMYRELLTTVNKKITDICLRYQEKKPREKNRLIGFIGNLLDKKILDEELRKSLDEVLRQRNDLVAEIEVLEVKLNELKAQNGDIDKQKEYFEALKKVLSDEMQNYRNQHAASKKQLDDQKAAQEASIAGLEKAHAQRLDEVRKFKVALPDLIREVFWGSPRETVMIEGILQSDSLYSELKEELTKLVERLQSKFDSSPAGLAMGEEKTALHQVIFRIENIEISKNSRKRPKRFISGTLHANVTSWNVVKSTPSQSLSFRYYYDERLISDKNGDLLKNDDLMAVVKTLLFEDIPKLKRATYEEANSIKNQRMLWGWIGNIMQQHPSTMLACDEGELGPVCDRQHRDEAQNEAESVGANNRFCVLCGFEEPLFKRAAPSNASQPEFPADSSGAH